MLRASSDALGVDIDLAATVGAETDSGLEHGALLVSFAEAVVKGDGTVAELRQALVDAAGPERAGHTIATITAFSGLVRVADGTGIPIDDGLAAASGDIREQLGLQDYGGAANSDVDTVEQTGFTTIDALFDNTPS